MEDFFSREIGEGLYMKFIGKPAAYTYLFTPNQIELYKIKNQGEKLIATDIDGINHSIEDPGYYDRDRRKVSCGNAIDCRDLIPVEDKNYENLIKDLLRTNERTSKLLKMMSFNKPNLSANQVESLNKNSENLLKIHKKP
jgi:hypothetical protein